ncbi:MAG: hypothetical protein V3U83_01990 [Acidobacteriota bacterium]
MRHEGNRNREECDRAERRGRRFFSLLLGTLVGIWLAACSGRDIVFVGDPLPGNPHITLINLTVCECDSCRVAIDDPETGLQVFNMVNPPLAQSVVADACYNTAMIRITVECGGCPSLVDCTAMADLEMEMDDGSGIIASVVSVMCTALPGPSAFCSAQGEFNIPSIKPVNPACPI